MDNLINSIVDTLDSNYSLILANGKIGVIMVKDNSTGKSYRLMCQEEYYG